mmetsp:Transcript_36458/g.46433  ORF Transcript_36458/g.46433 Transcript_36458/m.46433 type:complete len:382 (-) Transcript_36458:397-1542(-)
MQSLKNFFITPKPKLKQSSNVSRKEGNFVVQQEEPLITIDPLEEWMQSFAQLARIRHLRPSVDLSEKKEKDSNQHIRSFSCSLRGKRDHPNEDRYIICDSLEKYLQESKEFFSSKDITTEGFDRLYRARLFAVVDGHGGSLCAEYISQNFVLKIFENWGLLSEDDHNSDDFPDRLCDVLENTFFSLEKGFWEVSKQRKDSSGACIVAGLYLDGVLCVCNVGDAEAILINHRGNPIRMSRKHSYQDKLEVARVKKVGGFISSSGYLMNQIRPTRSIGDFDVKKCCKGALICAPDTHFVQLKEIPGGMKPAIFLASDGVWDVGKSKVVKFLINQMKSWRNSIETGSIEDYFHETGYGNPAQSVTEFAKDNGSRDDITTVFVQF